jgi:hypothetical protein
MAIPFYGAVQRIAEKAPEAKCGKVYFIALAFPRRAGMQTSARQMVSAATCAAITPAAPAHCGA